MKIDNNTISIIGVIFLGFIAIITALTVADREIGIGLVTIGSSAISGIIGYLARGSTIIARGEQ